MEHLVPLSLFTFAMAIFLAKNPVYGVLSFVVVVTHVVLILIALNLEFLAYTLAIVYIGAIVVLFLFVIMMFHIKEGVQRRPIARGAIEYWVLGYIVSFLLYNYSFFQSFEHIDYVRLIQEKSFVNLLSYTLFNHMAIFTIIAALLLFIGVVGSIILTLKESNITKVNTSKIRTSVKDTIKKKL